MMKSKLNSNKSVKPYIHELDMLWSKAVKRHGQCVYCGARAHAIALESHHLIKRTHFATRWSLANGVCLCAICHSMVENDANFREMFYNRVPASKMKKLRLWSAREPKLTITLLESIKETLCKEVYGQQSS